MTAGTVTITPVGGIGQIAAGDDLATIIADALLAGGLALSDGDVLVVSSKIVSKAAGLVTTDTDKDRVIDGESEYVVAERSVSGRVTRVVRAKAGPIMAAAGVDGSNLGVHDGWLLLPHDPDAAARSVWEGVHERFPVRFGVIVSDTAGRPWRIGQTDFALGAYAVEVVDDLRGGLDADGRPLEVTTRGIADEIAAAADLAKGKVTGVPVALVRGLGAYVTAAADHVFGARSLVRTGPNDWFGYGRVEAVRAALGIEPGSPESVAVGIAPVARSERLEAVRRAVAVALQGVPDAAADLSRDEVSFTAGGPFELGRVVARFESALWCEWLRGTVGTPSADGSSVVVSVAGYRPAARVGA